MPNRTMPIYCYDFRIYLVAFLSTLAYYFQTFFYVQLPYSVVFLLVLPAILHNNLKGYNMLNNIVKIEFPLIACIRELLLIFVFEVLFAMDLNQKKYETFRMMLHNYLFVLDIP